MKKILVTLLFIISISSLGWSADLQKGWDAYDSSDYTLALKEWLPLAEEGDASAQNNVAMLYKSTTLRFN